MNVNNLNASQVDGHGIPHRVTSPRDLTELTTSKAVDFSPEDQFETIELTSSNETPSSSIPDARAPNGSAQGRVKFILKGGLRGAAARRKGAIVGSKLAVGACCIGVICAASVVGGPLSAGLASWLSFGGLTAGSFVTGLLASAPVGLVALGAFAAFTLTGAVIGAAVGHVGSMIQARNELPAEP